MTSATKRGAGRQPARLGALDRICMCRSTAALFREVELPITLIDD